MSKNIITVFVFICIGMSYTLAQTVTLEATEDFDYKIEGYAPFQDADTRPDRVGMLSIDPIKYEDQWGAATATFPGETGTYDVILTYYIEVDGESSYKLFVDDVEVASFQYDPLASKDLEAPMTHTWKNIAVASSSQIRIEAQSHSNGTIPEKGAPGGYAWSRARWRSLEFTPVSTGIYRFQKEENAYTVLTGRQGITLSFPQEKEYLITVSTIQGEVVLRTKAKGSFTVPASKLNTGIQYIRMSTSKGVPVMSKKVMWIQ